MPKCADCGADIVWFISPYGKNVPFNSGAPPEFVLNDEAWDYSFPSHWETCRMLPKEPPSLTRE